jgi:hypothetical protein
MDPSTTNSNPTDTGRYDSPSKGLPSPAQARRELFVLALEAYDKGQISADTVKELFPTLLSEEQLSERSLKRGPAFLRVS